MLSERVRSGSEAAPWVVDEIKQLEDEIERLRKRVKELATALEFEANYDGHIALARSALQKKDTE